MLDQDNKEFEEKDIEEKAMEEQESDDIEMIDISEEDDKEEPSKASEEDYDKESEYEDVCFICRRPESKAGRMFKLPNHISVCSDCMHKTMDTVSQFDYQGMLNNTGGFGMDDTDGKKRRFPNTAGCIIKSFTQLNGRNRNMGRMVSTP